MGAFKRLVTETLGMFGGPDEPTPLPEVPDNMVDVQPEGDSTTEQAKLFIRTINTSRVYVTPEFLSIFRRDVVGHAVNLAKLGDREGWERKDDNYFQNKAKYMAVIDYLRSTNG